MEKNGIKKIRILKNWGNKMKNRDDYNDLLSDILKEDRKKY